jgi:hypothetical protein
MNSDDWGFSSLSREQCGDAYGIWVLRTEHPYFGDFLCLSASGLAQPGIVEIETAGLPSTL